MDASIELRRGETVLAKALPSGPRPDVTGDTTTPAAFSINCGHLLDAEAILEGSVSLFVVDAAGQAQKLEIFAPTRKSAVDEIQLSKFRTADVVTAAAILEAL